MQTLFDLSGKTALVTGASGLLGGHFCRVLAGAGAHVVMAARRRGDVGGCVSGERGDRGGIDGIGGGGGGG
jgi:NAD(P)-dependent dehydrogenase (short-subunit alcohol dehydrogenase family)